MENQTVTRAAQHHAPTDCGKTQDWRGKPCTRWRTTRATGVDLGTLGTVLFTLEKLTGKPVQLDDLLEVVRDGAT